LNERANSKPVDEGMGDMARKVGGMVKKVASKAMDTVGHGSDADMIRDLQRKMGVPQTGMKPGAEPNPKQVKEVTAPIDFDKVLDAIAALYGDDIWENDAMQDLANDLEQAGPTDRELDFIIAKGKLPKRLAGIQFSAGDSVRFGESSAPMSPKQKSFAALAPPENKITFADKIAGAKKEVDEMLGDVAAEAMKKALGGGRGRSAEMDEASTDNAFTAHKRPKIEKPAVGTVTHGRKHDVEEIPGGRRVTRRVDPSGISVGADDEAAQSGEKRGRGRPKKAGGPAQERVTANSRKADRTRFQSKKKVAEEVGSDDIEVLERLMDQAFAEGNKALGNALQTALERIQGDQDEDRYGDDEQVNEKAVSKKQQKFMGMVHAAQKGEKPASGAVAKTAKTMKKGDAEDFASTKHKGLPEKKKPEGKTDSGSEAPKKKKEKTEEAGGTGTPTASSGFGYGKGIYDSMNRDLENMIKENMNQLQESMNISMSMNNDSMHGGASKSLTVTATDEDAVKLGALLKMAGLGGGGSGGCGCGSSPCSCGSNAEVVDENQPDWPTDSEQAQDNFGYSGGLNKPKSTGQTTTPIIHTNDEERQHSYAAEEEDAIKRMMEMAGIAEAKGKKPDFLDVDKDGDKKEPFKKAVDDKKEEQVDESIFAMTAKLWKSYKG
jgi:hypothetical protein